MAMYETICETLASLPRGEVFLAHIVPRDPAVRDPHIYRSIIPDKHRIIVGRYDESKTGFHPEVAAVSILGLYTVQLASRDASEENYSLDIDHPDPPALGGIVDCADAESDEFFFGDEVFNALEKLGIGEYKPLVERIRTGGQIIKPFYGTEGKQIEALLEELAKK